MKHSLKIVGTIAIVGALAALAILNYSVDSPYSTFLARKEDDKVLLAFHKFIAKYHKSYLTRAEFKARFSNFKKAFNFVKMHNAKKEGFTVALN